MYTYTLFTNKNLKSIFYNISKKKCTIWIICTMNNILWRNNINFRKKLYNIQIKRSTKIKRKFQYTYTVGIGTQNSYSTQIY